MFKCLIFSVFCFRYTLNHVTFARNVKISRVTLNAALEWRYNTF